MVVRNVSYYGELAKELIRSSYLILAHQLTKKMITLVSAKSQSTLKDNYQTYLKAISKDTKVIKAYHLDVVQFLKALPYIGEKMIINDQSACTRWI